MTLPTHTMPIGAVAEVLGVTPSAVRLLDEALQPVRGRHNRRWYDPAVVMRVAEQRAARKSTR